MGEHDDGSSVVQLKPAKSAPRHGSHSSVILDFDDKGQPRVDVDGHSVVARATVAVSRADRGREVMVTFLDGDIGRPVITGLFTEPVGPAGQRHMKFNAAELDFEASSKLTFQCGKSSITLHRDGKIVLRGEHVVSRASGVNRIRGGSIELN